MARNPSPAKSAEHRWVLRIWLPDRPGSLAAVTGALSASGADVTAIDVVDRGAETAVDDITVHLTTAPIDDVVTAVTELDGVAVEDVRQRTGWRMTRAESLLAAAQLLDPRHVEPLPDLCRIVAAAVGAEWVAVTESDGHTIAEAGQLPDSAWLRSFAKGAGFSPSPRVIDDGAVFHRLGSQRANASGLVIGRAVPQFLRRELDEIDRT